MAVLHISEADLERNVRAVLERVRQGTEVIIEENHQPVAVLRSAVPPRRTVSEVLALMPKTSSARMDEGFAQDVESAIESHREALEPPIWD